MTREQFDLMCRISCVNECHVIFYLRGRLDIEPTVSGCSINAVSDGKFHLDPRRLPEGSIFYFARKRKFFTVWNDLLIGQLRQFHQGETRYARERRDPAAE